MTGQNDQPLGRILIYAFRNMERSFNYIYPGINIIGFDPSIAHIPLKFNETKTLKVQLIIQGYLNGAIEVMEPYIGSTKWMGTTLRGKEIEPGKWEKFEIDDKLKIAGLVTCKRVELNQDELNEDTRRCIVWANFYNRTTPRVAQKYRSQVVFMARRLSSNEKDPLEGNSLDTTWTIEDLTIPLEESYSSSQSSSSGAITPSRPMGNILTSDILDLRNLPPQRRLDHEEESVHEAESHSPGPSQQSNSD